MWLRIIWYLPYVVIAINKLSVAGKSCNKGGVFQVCSGSNCPPCWVASANGWDCYEYKEATFECPDFAKDVSGELNKPPEPKPKPLLKPDPQPIIDVLKPTREPELRPIPEVQPILPPPPPSRLTPRPPNPSFSLPPPSRAPKSDETESSSKKRHKNNEKKKSRKTPLSKDKEILDKSPNPDEMEKIGKSPNPADMELLNTTPNLDEMELPLGPNINDMQANSTTETDESSSYDFIHINLSWSLLSLVISLCLV